MDADEAKDQLRKEGFKSIMVVDDPPERYYSEHTHEGLTAHIVLEGEMTVTSEGETETYGAGKRFDVPAGEVHAARTGDEGCRYVVGEK